MLRRDSASRKQKWYVLLIRIISKILTVFVKCLEHVHWDEEWKKE